MLIRVFTAALLINSERTRKSVHSRVGDQGTAHSKPPAVGATAHGRLPCTLVSGGSRTQEQTLSEFQGQASRTMAPGDRGRLPLGVGDRCGGGRAAVPGTRNTCFSIPLHKGSECQSPAGVPVTDFIICTESQSPGAKVWAAFTTHVHVKSIPCSHSLPHCLTLPGGPVRPGGRSEAFMEMALESWFWAQGSKAVTV